MFIGMRDWAYRFNLNTRFDNQLPRMNCQTFSCGGKGAALVLPACNTEAMNLHLAEIATEVAPGKDAILLLDQAGWHLSSRLIVPPNITYFDLRPYRKRLLDRFEVWMNDGTPTIYTEKLSPVKLIFLKLCQSVEDVRFVSGKLQSVTPRGGGYQVRFEHGQTMTFERVATAVRHSA